MGARIQNIQTRDNVNVRYMNAVLDGGSLFIKDYMPTLSDGRNTWQRTWETEVGTTVQSNRETVTKNYVVDYLSMANRDIMVYEEGSFTQRNVYGQDGKRISTELSYAEGTQRGEAGENIASDTAVRLQKVWYRTSHLDSTLFAVDEQGEVITHTIYDPWGNPQSETKTDLNYTGLDNRNNYTGYTWDVTLELYFAQARFYAPEEHRFTQEDPVKDGGNWYIYVENGPLNYTDPWGLAYDDIVLGKAPSMRETNATKVAAAKAPVLTTGQTGNSVYDLQKKLASAGYYSHTELDGSYGTKTQAAVREFQRANGLKVDGSAGTQTWTALLGGNYVQGSDTQGRYSNQQLLNNEKKQQAAGGNNNKSTTPSKPPVSKGNNTPIPDGKFEQVQCSTTYVGAVYVNSDGLKFVGHSAVMLVRDDGQAELYSYNGNPKDIGWIIGYGALGLFWDVGTLNPIFPDAYIGTRPYLSVPIDKYGNEITVDFETFDGNLFTDSMEPGGRIEDHYYRGLYIPISDEQGQAMHEEARRIRENVLLGNDQGYNVTGNNCTMIAMDILGAGGIYTALESSAHPYSGLFIPNLEYWQMENGNVYDNWGNAWYEPGKKVEGIVPQDWPAGRAS